MSKSISKKGVVKKMREIRDAFGKEIMNMTLEEEKAYIKKALSELNPTKHYTQHHPSK